MAKSVRNGAKSAAVEITNKDIPPIASLSSSTDAIAETRESVPDADANNNAAIEAAAREATTREQAEREEALLRTLEAEIKEIKDRIAKGEDVGDDDLYTPRFAPYFRKKIELILDIERAAKEAKENIQTPIVTIYDQDKAATDNLLQAKQREKDFHVQQINRATAALERLDRGTFGVCVVTREPISLLRLDANKFSVVTAEVQQRREMAAPGHRPIYGRREY